MKETLIHHLPLDLVNIVILYVESWKSFYQPFYTKRSVSLAHQSASLEMITETHVQFIAKRKFWVILDNTLYQGELPTLLNADILFSSVHVEYLECAQIKYRCTFTLGKRSASRFKMKECTAILWPVPSEQVSVILRYFDLDEGENTQGNLESVY
jgi:hypothetical protein